MLVWRSLLPPSGAEIRTSWRYISTPPSGFTAQYLTEQFIVYYCQYLYSYIYTLYTIILGNKYDQNSARNGNMGVAEGCGTFIFVTGRRENMAGSRKTTLFEIAGSRVAAEARSPLGKGNNKKSLVCERNNCTGP
jgi:hypothetical protein